MLKDLEEAFQYEVLKMLKKEGKINDAIIDNMLSWHHSGFNVYIGDRIEHIVRYFGFFSNKPRGMRKKADADDVPGTRRHTTCCVPPGAGAYFSEL
jgi:hypothetical protein